MLENSAGYKGPIPRISYSRYFSTDEEKQEQSGKRLGKIFCSKGRNTNRYTVDPPASKQEKGLSELLKYRPQSCACGEIATHGKKYLLLPTQNSQTTAGSSREKQSTSNTRAEGKPLLEFSQGFCRWHETSPFSTKIHEEVCFKFDNDFYIKRQHGVKPESMYVRPPTVKNNYEDIDEADEMQREKIVNAWMKFFG